MPDREICRRRVLSEDYRDFILSGSKGFREEFSEENLCRIPLEYTFQIAFLENEGEKNGLQDILNSNNDIIDDLKECD